MRSCTHCRYYTIKTLTVSFLHAPSNTQLPSTEEHRLRLTAPHSRSHSRGCADRGRHSARSAPLSFCRIWTLGKKNR